MHKINKLYAKISNADLEALSHTTLVWYPLIIGGIASCISYWLRVICSNPENLASKAYLEQFNSSGEKYAWLNFVKRVLFDLGFSHVWNNQSTFNISSLLLSIKNKLILLEQSHQF